MARKIIVDKTGKVLGIRKVTFTKDGKPEERESLVLLDGLDSFDIGFNGSQEREVKALKVGDNVKLQIAVSAYKDNLYFQYAGAKF